MNLIEALLTGKPVRRPISKHKGSHGFGYLGNDYVKILLLSYANRQVGYEYPFQDFLLIDENDLLADDWEVKD